MICKIHSGGYTKCHGNLVKCLCVLYCYPPSCHESLLSSCLSWVTVIFLAVMSQLLSSWLSWFTVIFLAVMIHCYPPGCHESLLSSWLSWVTYPPVCHESLLSFWLSWVTVILLAVVSHCYLPGCHESLLSSWLSCVIVSFCLNMWTSDLEMNGQLIAYTLRKDFVILQLYWWLFSSTKHCSWNMV